MFIQTIETPNPETLKFMPGRALIEDGFGVDFPTAAAAVNCPLALRLFEIEGVKEVFIGADFISVTKTDTWDWYVLKPLILGSIMDVLMTGEPIFRDVQATVSNVQDDEDPIVAQIKDLLDTRIRPAVAMDGGDITFHRFEEGIVYLEMKGACSGCPSSTLTLKSGIENMLKHYVPEVIAVESI